MVDVIRQVVNSVRSEHNIVERNRNDVVFRIERSMVQSLLDIPAIGLEQMRFKFEENPDLEGSFATDGEIIFYNPFVVSKMTEQQLNTALCHQTLHFILRHLQRREDRNVERWDIACDHEVKVVLSDEIKNSDHRWFVDNHFDKNMIRNNLPSGTTAEEIYDMMVGHNDRDNDIHSLWDLAKMESTRLKDTAPAEFDASRVLAGDKIEIPEDLTEQYKMVEATAIYINKKNQFLGFEIDNILQFSYNFPTALCVYLLKRTVVHDYFRNKVLKQQSWIVWSQIYKSYIL